MINWLSILLLTAIVALIIALSILLYKKHQHERTTAQRLTSLINRIKLDLGERTKNIKSHINGQTTDLYTILEEKINELAHKVQNHEFKDIMLDTIDTGIIVLNMKKEIKSINQFAAALFNSKVDTAINQPLISITRDYEIDALIQQCIESGKAQSKIIEFSINKIYLEINARIFNDSVILIIKDVSEVKKDEKIRQYLVSNVAHEMRTPLASIMAIIETLRSGSIENKETADDFLNRMQVESEKLLQIVNELNELSALESGRMPLKMETFDIIGLIKYVIERMSTQAMRAGININTKFNLDVLPIKADKSRIEQVLVNLIHNAIKFSPNGGKVNITADLDLNDNFLYVSITDTGIGISKEELERIFERFYKVDKSRSSSGSGLGLSIAKHVVTAHGGTIWAESEEGKGSTFTFKLPVNVR